MTSRLSLRFCGRLLQLFYMYRARRCSIVSVVSWPFSNWPGFHFLSMLVLYAFGFISHLFRIFCLVRCVVCGSHDLPSLGCKCVLSFPTCAIELGPLFLDILAHLALCSFMLFSTFFRLICCTFLYSFKSALCAPGRGGAVCDSAWLGPFNK